VDAFLEDRDARTGPPSERNAEALTAVRRLALDPTCIEALEAVLGRSGGRRAPKGPAELSEREQEILALVARGLTNKEIARELHLSPHTVRHHLEHIYEKIDVVSRAGATLFAAEHGYA
jgi:DNA-binding NarL/FixJ family response regulator